MMNAGLRQQGIECFHHSFFFGMLADVMDSSEEYFKKDSERLLTKAKGYANSMLGYHDFLFGDAQPTFSSEGAALNVHFQSKLFKTNTLEEKRNSLVNLRNNVDELLEKPCDYESKAFKEIKFWANKCYGQASYYLNITPVAR